MYSKPREFHQYSPSTVIIFTTTTKLQITFMSTVLQLSEKRNGGNTGLLIVPQNYSKPPTIFNFISQKSKSFGNLNIEISLEIPYSSFEFGFRFRVLVLEKL